MKTAREMFEELGYEQCQSDNYCIEYECTNEDEGNWKSVYFNLNYKTFNATNIYSSMAIDTKTFKAIQKQLEELGWI